MPKFLFFLSCALAPGINYAQIFICKDAAGRTITSDRPVPECANRATREMNNHGIVKREIAAPLTPEQKRQKQILEEQQKAEQAALEAQKLRDQIMMARYSSPKAIETARQREREPLQERMVASGTTIATLDSILKQANEEKEFYKKKTLPQKLVRRIEETELAISTERSNILRYGQELVEVDAKFDAIAKRYREISQGSAGNPAPQKEPAAANPKP